MRSLSRRGDGDGDRFGEKKVKRISQRLSTASSLDLTLGRRLPYTVREKLEIDGACATSLTGLWGKAISQAIPLPRWSTES